MNNTIIHDYIIVGAGSAGCVLANRLSEDPSTDVLLIEAGGRDNSILIQMPVSCGLAARDPRFNWGYVGDPEPYCDDRQIIEHRGRVLGGSSSVNGMVANRGNPKDYDAWTAEGLPEWRFENCLPYFRKMETTDRGPSRWRGHNGPQPIESCKADHPLHQAFLRAGEQAGYLITEDQNGEHHEGFHIAQGFTREGYRYSTARSYLRPVIARDNLTVLTDTLTLRVVFDAKRAVAVDVEHKGVIARYEAEKEIILSGGAINSPQLLMLSGIGNPGHLREHGIEVVSELPAVGQNLENHQIVPISYATEKNVSISGHLNGFRKYLTALEWLLFKSGYGTSIMCETGCFFKSSEDVDYANIQHEFYPLTSEMGEAKSNCAEGFMFSMGLMRPQSRGCVSLISPNPRDKPSILYNFFAEMNDRQAMIDGLRRTREMAAQQAFAHLNIGEIDPGEDIQSDTEIMAWLRANATTEFHPCSTCRMGTGDDSVTDSQGRVHTLEALRVVDASIMPHNVTANLNAPVIMMAEKIADDICKG